MSTLTIWTLSVDDGESSNTSIHLNEEDALDSLIANYGDGQDLDRETVVDHLTTRQGIVLYLYSHDLQFPVPAGLAEAKATVEAAKAADSNDDEFEAAYDYIEALEDALSDFGILVPSPPETEGD